MSDYRQEDEDFQFAQSDTIMNENDYFRMINAHNLNENDWSRKTDFTDIRSIGYLCDDGVVIKGDCLRQNQTNHKIFVHFNTESQHYGKKHDWISVPNERICAPPTDRRNNYNSNPISRLNVQPSNVQPSNLQPEEYFQPQQLVTYQEAIDMLLHINCCFGFYDKKIKCWRTAVFMKKWDNIKRLMIRFTQEPSIKPSSTSDKFLTIKTFPVNFIILNNNKKFTVKERDLRDMSNVPKENIDLWVLKKTKKGKIKLIEKRKKQCEMLVVGFIKYQKKTQQIATIFPGLKQMITHYCCILFDELPIIRISQPPQQTSSINTYTYDYGFNRNTYNINKEDNDLQRAIAASLQDVNKPK